MNANAIFSGEEYAYAPYRSKGQFPSNCIKVIALASRKTREPDNQRYSTEVQIENEDGRIYWVRARDIYADWHTYSDELNDYNERKRLHQERIAKAEAERKAVLEAQFVEAATLLNLPRELLVSFSYNRKTVAVDLDALREYRRV